MHKDEIKEKINNAIKDGFGNDWYYRAEIQSVYVITDDNYVILNVYYAEPEDVYLMTVKLENFSAILESKIIECK